MHRPHIAVTKTVSHAAKVHKSISIKVANGKSSGTAKAKICTK